MNLAKQLTDMVGRAKAASLSMPEISSATKNKILREMAKALFAKKALILAANKKDLAKAKVARISAALTDRLKLDDKSP